MDYPGILPTIVGAVAAFMFGAAYYGALSKPWMKAARVDPANATMSPALFVVTFLFTLGISVGVGTFFATLGIVGSIPSAIAVAVIAWAAFTLCPMVVNHRYQGFGWGLTLIDGLYWLGVFIIIALAHTLMSGAAKVGV